MTQISPALWGIPVVATSTERDARFPSPSLHQRVHNLQQGTIERWNGTSWTTDFIAGTLSTGTPALHVNGVEVLAQAQVFDFVGAGVSGEADGVIGRVNVRIPAAKNAGGTVVAAPTGFKFQGTGVTVSADGTDAVIAITAGGGVVVQDAGTPVGPGAVGTLNFIGASAIAEGTGGRIDITLGGATGTPDYLARFDALGQIADAPQHLGFSPVQAVPTLFTGRDHAGGGLTYGIGFGDAIDTMPEYGLMLVPPSSVPVMVTLNDDGDDAWMLATLVTFPGFSVLAVQLGSDMLNTEVWGKSQLRLTASAAYPGSRTVLLEDQHLKPEAEDATFGMFLGHPDNRWRNLYALTVDLEGTDGAAAATAVFTNAPTAETVQYIPATFNGAAGWLPFIPSGV